MAEYTNDMFGLQQLMRDEEAAKEEAAIVNAVNLAGTPRASMLANTINIAKGQGNAYANLGRMLTGEGAPVDPRVERMQRLKSIADQMPDPQTEQDYLKLAQMLRAADLPGEAQKAMEMVNSIRSAAAAAAAKTYTDVEEATRFLSSGELVPGESARKTPTPTELSLDQLFTNTVENDPAFIAAVERKDVPAQQKIIATAKRNLALSDDISNQQVQLFTVSSLDANGNTILSDVWRQWDKTTNQWVDLVSTEQQKKAAVTRTYVDDTDEGKFSITEEAVNGVFVEIARTNVDIIPNSFEQVAVNHVLSIPGYENLDKETQSELLLEAKKSISIPTTESAINAAYRDINENFIRLAQQEASVNGNENFQSEGRTIGNTRFLEWKNSLAENIAKAGGNTNISDVLGQNTQWENLTSKVMNDFDQMANLKFLIGQAKGQKAGSDESIKQNAAAWATATRLIVSLTKDSNLSTAEVQTVANAGSIPRKLANLISKAATGVSTDASIKEIEEIAFGLEQSIIRRYNKHHTSFNETMLLAGTNPDLLKAMTGDLLNTPVTTRAATKNHLVEEAIRRGIYTVVDGITYDQNGNPIME